MQHLDTRRIFKDTDLPGIIALQKLNEQYRQTMPGRPNSQSGRSGRLSFPVSYDQVKHITRSFMLSRIKLRCRLVCLDQDRALVVNLDQFIEIGRAHV